MQSHIRHHEWVCCGPCHRGISVSAAPIATSGRRRIVARRVIRKSHSVVFPVSHEGWSVARSKACAASEVKRIPTSRPRKADRRFGGRSAFPPPRQHNKRARRRRGLVLCLAMRRESREVACAARSTRSTTTYVRNLAKHCFREIMLAWKRRDSARRRVLSVGTFLRIRKHAVNKKPWAC